MFDDAPEAWNDIKSNCPNRTANRGEILASTPPPKIIANPLFVPREEPLKSADW